MKLRLFTAGILLPGMIFAGSAEDTDLSGYTGAETETSLESIVANGGFERGADGWILKRLPDREERRAQWNCGFAL